jgi:hypothetical protein
MPREAREHLDAIQRAAAAEREAMTERQLAKVTQAPHQGDRERARRLRRAERASPQPPDSKG